MRARVALVAALVLVPATVATALAATRRSRVEIDFVPAWRFDEIRTYATNTRTMGGTVSIAADEQTAYMLVRRTRESEVEEHSRWDDVILVRAGAGTVVFAPRARGARLVALGELRGGTMAAPDSQHLRVGDMARIPAGVPHTFVPSGSEPWELLIVKVRRPNRPLRRSAE